MRATHIVGPQGQEVYNLQVSPESLVKQVGKEIGIFEIREHSQVNGNTQGHHGFFPWLFPEIVNGQPYQVIRKGGKNQEKEKKSTGLIIKEQADQEEVSISKAPLFIQDGINGQDHQQESPEIQPGK